MKARYFLLLFTFSLIGSCFGATPWQANELSHLIGSGSWQAVEKFSTKLLQSNPTPQQQSLLTYNLGLSQLQQKKYSQAQQSFESVIKSKVMPDLQAKASYNLGLSLYGLKKIEEAKKAFEQALLLNPNDDDSRHNIEVLQKDQQSKKSSSPKDKPQKPQSSPKNDQQEQKGQKKDPSDHKDGPRRDRSDKDKKPGQPGSSPQDSRPGDHRSPGQQNGSPGQTPTQSQPHQPPSDGKDKGEGAQPKDPFHGQAASGPPMTAAQKEAAERSRLLDFFRQQERDGRPPVRAVPQQRPPVGGQTW